MAKIQTATGWTLDATIKSINPAVAKQMLAVGFRNRRLQKTRIRRYAQAMDNKEWIISQPLMVNCDGSLIDGQHRLHAVRLHGKPVDFLVIKGFDRDATFAKIDDVATRRLKDWFQINGENLPEILAGVVGMAARDDAGVLPTSGTANFQFTPIEGIEFLKGHTKIRKSVGAPGTCNQLVPRTMASFCHYKFAQVDMPAADAFFVELVMGEKEGAQDPLYLLRERLAANQRAKNKISRTEKLALIIKTWNAIRSNKKVHNLIWRSTGPQAEAFPEVI